MPALVARRDEGGDVSEEDAMLIVTVLRTKAGEGAGAVVTVSPDSSVRDLLETLAQHRIGAVVVSAGDGIAGIVSERDVVRHLRASGASILDRPRARILTPHPGPWPPGAPAD